MPSSKEVGRDAIRDIHLWLETSGLSRSTLFTLVFALHLLSPILTIYLFIVSPRARPLVVFALCIVVYVQLATRTCPIAKIEWSLDPRMETVTWNGAEVLNEFWDVNKRFKFYFMIVTTLFGVVWMTLVARYLPRGLKF